MKSQTSGTSITSEDIVIGNLEKNLIQIGVQPQNSRLNYESLSTCGHKRSKYNAAVEVTNMKMQLEEMKKQQSLPNIIQNYIQRSAFYQGLVNNFTKQNTPTHVSRKSVNMKADVIYLTRSAELQSCYLTIRIQNGIIGMDQGIKETFSSQTMKGFMWMHLLTNTIRSQVLYSTQIQM